MPSRASRFRQEGRYQRVTFYPPPTPPGGNSMRRLRTVIAAPVAIPLALAATLLATGCSKDSPTQPGSSSMTQQVADDVAVGIGAQTKADSGNATAEFSIITSEF